MKKFVSLLLTLAMVLSMVACGTPAETTTEAPAAETTTEAPVVETEPAGIYTPGTYTAESRGMGKVTVSVTVDANNIVSIDLVDISGETPGLGDKGAQTVADRILTAQSTDVDTASGATMSSKAVINAVNDCLAQASGLGEEPVAAIADGTYTGTAASFGWQGMMTCEVTFAGGKITNIVVTEETDTLTGEWFANAEELLIPRIIEAQSLAVDSIAGATVSSSGIKGCVANAIEAAGGNTADWYAEVAKKTETVKIEGYDVIVVGMGGSGILSYCAAADNGATVFGIETAGKIGGNSACTTGPMAINSEYLKKLYTEGQDYFNPEELYNIWIDYVGSEDKADIIYKAVYNSGSALDYFVENFQFDFSGRGLIGSFAVPTWTKLWTQYTPDPETGRNALGPNKTYQFDRALDIATAMNDKNDYMTELTATSLIFDANGAVIGVNAEYYDGTKYEVYGKSVILATGGFIGNEEMMNQYLDAKTPINTLGVTTCDGDGIQMGISAGGATYMMSTLPMVHISQVQNMIKNNDLTADQKAILTALALTTDMPMVNLNGEAHSGDIIFAPDYRYFVMYSQADIDAIRTTGLSAAQSKATSYFMGQGGKLPEAGTPVADIDEILAVGMDYNNVIKAENLAEMAKVLGCDEATLKATLGEDGVYYAVICTSYAYATVGGLDVDVNMNVLREDGTAIANLFAVGQDSEGVCNVDGKAYSPWGGQAQSWTFVSGQIAGTQAAAYAQGK